MLCKTTVKTSKILAALVIVLVSSCKTAQKTAETQIFDKPILSEKTLLWQISGRGLAAPSYLFGTIHVISGNDYFLGENVIQKLNLSQKLILEMDLSQVDAQEVAKASVLPEDKTIKDFYTEEEYIEVESYFADSLGAPVSLFKTAYARLKPFFLQQFIYLQYLGDNTSSYEMNLMDMAKVRDIEISGLETLTQQLALVDQMSLEDQYQSFLKTVREGYKQAAYLDELIEVYKDADIHKLHEMIAEYEDIQDFAYMLVDERNINWVKKLTPEFSKGSMFVAVGAGHLGGKFGLIELLRNEGYTVEPVSMD